MVLRISMLWLFGLVLGSAQHLVHPDQHWFDTNGDRIEAHAAGMLKSPLDGRWYWYGESKKQKHQSTTTEGINCYSAETIAGPWKFEGEVISQEDVVIPGETGPWVMQRPKVLFNDATQKYVMYWHLDLPKHKFALGLGGYQFKRAGTATADHPAGPFTFVRAYRPDGLGSLDMNLFKDPLDGQAYLIRDCEHKYVGISRLSEDYLNSTGIIAKVDKCEGMAMFRLQNGSYYMITSHLTGWNPNPLIAWRSKGTALDDAEWINLGNPTQEKTSFNSQPTYVVQYTPEKGDPYYVYMGDDWVNCPNPNGTNGNLVDACYVWLPILMDGPNASLPLQIDNRRQWDLEDPFAPAPPSGDMLAI